MSYPLTPMKTINQFNFDPFIFPGNSGGPVYFSYVNRPFKGQLPLGIEQGIFGLVIQEGHPGRPEFSDKTLNFGIVLPSIFIRETIDMLLPKP